MKTAVIDASSSILLHKAGLFQALVNHYHVLMPPSVYAEITVADYPGDGAFKHCRDRALMRIDSPPHDGNRGPFLPAMGRGEADTLRLFTVFPQSFVIMDDGKGARYCRDHEIPYINALLVPKILFFSGQLPRSEYRLAMETLSRLDRYSGFVLNFARTCTFEDMACFFAALTF
jgi:hypothetical protein